MVYSGYLLMRRTAMNTKNHTAIRNMTRCALLAVLMAVCAWISIPTTIPFTLQTFGVFLALGLLGGRLGCRSILVYVLLGALGAPVFHAFTGGMGILLGGSGGYILGFLLTGLVYWSVTACFGERPAVMAAAMILGLAACYAFGTAWFMAFYARTAGPIGLGAALGLCVFPFILPDAVKLLLALTLSRQLKKLL